MIEFAKITKTLDGYDCHYFGTRESYGTKLHCFGVWTSTGLHEKCYDEQGRRLDWEPNSMGWKVCKSDAFAIIKPPKIVEVTRWVGLFDDGEGEYHVSVSSCEENLEHRLFLAKQQHTFRFEVPNE